MSCCILWANMLRICYFMCLKSFYSPQGTFSNSVYCREMKSGFGSCRCYCLLLAVNCELCYSQKLNQTTNIKVDIFIFKCMRYQLWFAMQLELFLCVIEQMAADFLTHYEVMVSLIVSSWLHWYFNYFIRPWPLAGSDKEPTGSSTYLPSQGTLPLLTHPRLADNKDLSQSQRNISGEATVIDICEYCYCNRIFMLWCKSSSCRTWFCVVSVRLRADLSFVSICSVYICSPNAAAVSQLAAGFMLAILLDSERQRYETSLCMIYITF
jgi:hypothetical protein